jgi:prepilin signal peptidase PulO-like enzyme (type II secretory pathway)
MKTILKVGFGAGLVSGGLCVLLYYVLCGLLDLQFVQLNPVSIMIVSVVVNVIGALIYSKILSATSSPRLFYGLITISVALTLSIYDWAYPAEPDIAGIANTLHAFVASLSIAWIPTWLNKRCSPTYTTGK